ncbi:helix-turn-helix domain-containing protein [Streptomyces sp. NPDC127084]|uniref:helix-turn-helix domain-containing protein n=1 Tax=Streptomyces sp. NPDC127084 TaxID=3347133 RepID=UPI003647411F
MPDRTDNQGGSRLTFAQRARLARDRAGLTRPVVAGLVGRSSDWVKSIENGLIGMPRLPMLLRLAHIYGVDPADLIGDERLATASYTKAIHGDLPAIKNALTTYRLRPADRTPESAEVLGARVRQAWKLWHSKGDHRSRIATLLPDLLADTEHSSRTLDGADRRRALVAQGQAYHLAQLFLSFQPAPELVVLTGDRAMTAAQDADSPRAIAAAAWYMNHVYRDANEAAEARVDLAEQAAALLSQDDQDDLARWGLLQLAVALSFAKVGRAGDAWRYWDRANDAARRLGPDYAHPWLVFGQGIVDGYALTMFNDLMQPGKALEVAEALDLDAIPSATRRSYHLIETARAHGMQDEGVAAVALLQKAFRESPETIQYNVYTRMALPELVKTGPRMVREDAQHLAQGLGVPV